MFRGTERGGDAEERAREREGELAPLPQIATEATTRLFNLFVCCFFSSAASARRTMQSATVDERSFAFDRLKPY